MKKTKYILFTLMCLFTVLIFPSASSELGLCEESGVRQTFQIIGYFLFILKIVIPIILVVLGTTDLIKAMLSNEATAFKRVGRSLVRRLVAAVIIFFVPTIVGFAFTLVDGINDEGKYDKCISCLNHPGSCEIDR